MDPNSLYTHLISDLDWEVSVSVDEKIRRERYRRAFVCCFYPRTLACFTIFSVLGKPSRISQKKYSMNDIKTTVTSLTYTWVVVDVEKLKTMFPGKFEKRVYTDSMGRQNFDLSKGRIAGGNLIPLINERNPCKVSYDFYRQKLKFNFLVYKEKCILSEQQGTEWVEVLI